MMKEGDGEKKRPRTWSSGVSVLQRYVPVSVWREDQGKRARIPVSFPLLNSRISSLSASL